MLWSVVVLEKSERHVETFEDEAKAMEVYELMKTKFPKAKVGFISRSRAIPPDDRPKPKAKKKGKEIIYWCPYCGDYRTFVTGPHGKQCPMCTISQEDFYVKNYNHLWK